MSLICPREECPVQRSYEAIMEHFSAGGWKPCPQEVIETCKLCHRNAGWKINSQGETKPHHPPPT